MSTALVSALAVFVAIQATALALRLRGLSCLPRATPHALWPLLAVLAAAAATWSAVRGGVASALGLLLGAPLALLLPSLRPLRPDQVLLRGAVPLEVPGHADARAVLLAPEKAPRALVVFAHGLGNDRTFGLWQAVPRLVERGLAVVLFHQAGHGAGGADLASTQSLRVRFDAVLAAARSAVPGRVIAVGQSMGGAMVLDAIARGVPLDAAITVSPIARLELGARIARELGVIFHAAAWRVLRFATLFEILPATGAFHRDHFPVRVAEGRSHLEVFKEILAELDLIQRLRAAPKGALVTILHGRLDGIVPVEQGRALAQALGDRARLVELPWAHHLDPLFDDEAIQPIAELAFSLVSTPDGR